MIKESSMPTFQVKKVQKFLRSQHKDDDVQSDEELVKNTRYQVISNLKVSISDFNKVPSSCANSAPHFIQYRSELL